TPIALEASIDWFYPIIQPYRTIKNAVGIQQNNAWGLFTPPEIVVLGWYPTYPQPYPFKRLLRTDLQRAFFWNTSLKPEEVLPGSWFVPTAQPYPYLKMLPVALQLFSSWD